MIYAEYRNNLIYLNSQYADKEKLKSCGAKWDLKESKWYIAFDLRIWNELERSLGERLVCSPILKSFLIRRQKEEDNFLDAKKNAEEDKPIDFEVPGLLYNGINPLFNYQKHGVQCGCIVGDGFLIGDQPGLGKSIQGIGIALERRRRGEIESCMIVCPASLKYNWVQEIQKFTKEKFLVIDGDKEERKQKWFAKGYFFKIVNYEAIVSDIYTDSKKGVDKRIDGSDYILNNQDLLILDECFSYHSRVLLSDGSQKYIGDIVIHQIPCDVLSFNFEKNCFESKPITNWFSNGKKKLVRIKTQYGTVKSTENHKYYDINGNVILAGQLKRGDKIAVYNKFGFGNEQIPLLAGTLLGDGCLAKFSDASRARLMTTHGKKQQEYAKWKELVFGNSSGGVIENRGFGEESYCFRTKSVYPNHIYNIFYKNAKKTVTKEWLDHLNEFSLALWYMDDGYTQERTYTKKSVQKILDNKEYILEHKQDYLLSRKKPFYFKKHELKKITSRWTKEFFDIISSENIEECAKKRLYTTSYLCCLCTNGFSKEEVYLMSSYLKQKFGLDNFVSWSKNKNGKNNDYYTIVFQRKSSIKLLKMISKYVPECMRYKLCGIGNDYDDTAVKNQIKSNCLFETEIMSVEDAGDDYTFNIEVADNHNYICGGSLVSNCQYIKNHTSQRTKIMKKFKAKYRVGLTGTPLDGRLEELHSIFQFLKPGLFPNKTMFMDRYAILDRFNRVIKYRHEEEIKEKIKPYYIRRLKENVLKELPPKMFKDVFVELPKKEKKAYMDLIKGKSEVTQESQAATIVLRARQFLDFPELLDMRNPSAKYAALSELLSELIKENKEKVIIFTQFKKALHLIVKNLESDYNIVCIHGDIPASERIEICNRFNNDPSVNIIIMTNAGATGLNLASAHSVINYEDDFSPATNLQRFDRAHRANTRHTVTIYRFISLGTIEEHVRDILDTKMSLCNKILDENISDLSSPVMSSMDMMKLL